MVQTARVTREIKAGYVEVSVSRVSACDSAHSCNSCGGCSMAKTSQEIKAVAEDHLGARPGDIVTVETSTSHVLGAAVVLYLVPIALFVLGAICGYSFGWDDKPALALGGCGFLLGLLCAVGLDRYSRKHHTFDVQITSILSRRR